MLQIVQIVVREASGLSVGSRAYRVVRMGRVAISLKLAATLPLPISTLACQSSKATRFYSYHDPSLRTGTARQTS